MVHLSGVEFDPLPRNAFGLVADTRKSHCDEGTQRALKRKKVLKSSDPESQRLLESNSSVKKYDDEDLELRSWSLLQLGKMFLSSWFEWTVWLPTLQRLVGQVSPEDSQNEAANCCKTMGFFSRTCKETFCGKRMGADVKTWTEALTVMDRNFMQALRLQQVFREILWQGGPTALRGVCGSHFEEKQEKESGN
ncbi:hypothetical protein HPP92_025058 [Vanilla planifolia]|uniref:Uncharacterized protein n=1 Tax=Vanilla planifolia TaxID=51239 RepID=A0A835PIC7_VANPL|nr:hypothetical protein HPP92_025058 [Vanilla planifolia]